MSQLITLDYFNAKSQHYHVYKLRSSSVAELPHYHDYFQVCFVACGEILHSQEDKSVRLGHGDAFVIPPCFVHNINFASQNAEIYSLSFSEALFHSGFSQSNVYKFLQMLQEDVINSVNQPIRLKLILNDCQRKNVQALFDCLLRECDSDYPKELSAAASFIAAMLYTLSQSYYEQPQNIEGFNEIAAYSGSITRCMEFIDSHYNEAISIDVLAKQFAMSRSTFCTLFPQFAGLPLKQYINKKRIVEAESLIRSRPELTLNEIAGAIGYDDNSTFYRNFIRIVGISPSRYKETYCGRQ